MQRFLTNLFTLFKFPIWFKSNKIITCRVDENYQYLNNEVDV